MISIVITYFNKGYLLYKSIDSALSNLPQVGNSEIIVVNDCSTCRISQNVFLSVQQKYKTIKFFTCPKNLGAAGAKNFGISQASQPVICLLDADDILPGGSLLAISEAFSKYPSAVLVYGNYLIQGNHGLEVFVSCKGITYDGHIDGSRLVSNWILLGSSPFRKSVFYDLGGFDQRFPRTDDVDFHRRLICKYENDIRYIDHTIYKWNRVASENFLSVDRFDNSLAFFRNIIFYWKFDSVFGFFFKFIKYSIGLILGWKKFF